jgi:hypothetical protein
MLLRFAPLAAALLFAQGPAFEGTLRMRTIEIQLETDGLVERWLDVAPATLAGREDAEIDEATMRVKGKVLRLEGKDGDQGFGLLDFGRHVMTMVDPVSRMYLEFPLPAGDGGAAPGRPAASLVKPLGRARVMNGVNVKAYEIRRQDEIILAWLTQDFPGLTGSFRGMSERMADQDDADDAAMNELMRHGFPVLVITLTDRSVRYEEMVSIDRSPLSADLFRVPAGFTKHSLPGGP